MEGMEGRMGLVFLPAPEIHHHPPQLLTSHQHCNYIVAGSNPTLLGLKMCQFSLCFVSLKLALLRLQQTNSSLSMNQPFSSLICRLNEHFTTKMIICISPRVTLNL